MAFTELGVYLRHGSDSNSTSETISITPSSNMLVAFLGQRALQTPGATVAFNTTETLTERIANTSGGSTSNTDRMLHAHDLDSPTATTANIVWSGMDNVDRRWVWVGEGPYDASSGPWNVNTDYEIGSATTSFSFTRTPAGVNYGVIGGIVGSSGSPVMAEAAGSTITEVVHEDSAVAGTQGPDAFVFSDGDLGAVASEIVAYDSATGEWACGVLWYAPTGAPPTAPHMLMMMGVG